MGDYEEAADEFLECLDTEVAVPIRPKAQSIPDGVHPDLLDLANVIRQVEVGFKQLRSQLVTVETSLRDVNESNTSVHDKVLMLETSVRALENHAMSNVGGQARLEQRLGEMEARMARLENPRMPFRPRSLHHPEVSFDVPLQLELSPSERLQRATSLTSLHSESDEVEVEQDGGSTHVALRAPHIGNIARSKSFNDIATKTPTRKSASFNENDLAKPQAPEEGSDVGEQDRHVRSKSLKVTSNANKRLSWNDGLPTALKDVSSKFRESKLSLASIESGPSVSDVSLEVAVKDLHATKAGFLELKKHTGFKGHKRYYCALVNHYLYIYRGDKDTKAKHALNLTGFKLTETTKKRHFELTAPKEKDSRSFQAQTKEDAGSWMLAIKNALASATAGHVEEEHVVHATEEVADDEPDFTNDLYHVENNNEHFFPLSSPLSESKHTR